MMVEVCKTRNFIFYEIMTSNGKEWCVIFLYGSSQQQHCQQLWCDVQQILTSYSKFMIIGYINQVDAYANKLGGTTYMRGWEDIIAWKQTLNLQYVPFHGPRFTWSNVRERNYLILEHLDRAYVSLDWLEDFQILVFATFPLLFLIMPLFCFKQNFPLQRSKDHIKLRHGV